MKLIKKATIIGCMLVLASANSFAQKKQMTTNSGRIVGDNQNSKTVGQNGPTLLEDSHLIEKLSAFDRERIPERVVHARGVGAYGEFESFGDYSDLTMTKMFNQKGKKTPMFVRFSTVIGGSGSPETVRDPRGFALKFYTEEGNWDIVGNNTPIFFIRDAMKFPDMIHSLKPSPIYNKQDPNRYFDFFSHIPEATHMLTMIYTDFGTPANFRQIPGAGGHAFKWINEKGEVVYVKFSWESLQGEKFLTMEEAAKIQGMSSQHATTDLYENIEKGNFPSWYFFVQFMKPQDLDKYDFNPLDVTKIWPEKIAPKKLIGKFTLNRVPDNFFEEVEQATMAPSNMVPGVAPSEDKMLQGRLFSYFDSQLYRVGPNHMQLPVNAPKMAANNNSQGGSMSNRNKGKNDINYQPSSQDNTLTDNTKYKYPQTTYNDATTIQGKITKPNDFGQAGDYYRALPEGQKENLIKNLTADLSQVKNKEIVYKMIYHFYMADKDYGMKLAKALNVDRNEVESFIMKAAKK